MDKEIKKYLEKQIFPLYKNQDILLNILTEYDLIKNPTSKTNLKPLSETQKTHQFIITELENMVQEYNYDDFDMK